MLIFCISGECMAVVLSLFILIVFNLYLCKSVQNKFLFKITAYQNDLFDCHAFFSFFLDSLYTCLWIWIFFLSLVLCICLSAWLPLSLPATPHMYVCLLAFLCLKVPLTHQYTSMGGFPPLYLGQLTETHPYLPFLCLSPSLSPSLPLSLRFLSLLTLTQCRPAADSRFFIFYKCFTPSFTMMQKSMLFS